MVLFAWRTRIAVLWILIAMGMSIHMLLATFIPGLLGDLMEGHLEETEITEWFVVMAALFWLVPLAMAFLSMVLPDRADRYANAGVGVIVTAMWAWHLIEHLVASEEMTAGMSLANAFTVAAGLTILWHVWKWPGVRNEEPMV